jgi:phosphoenolpyruvate-protein kinase (PTS system EI component)
MTETPLTDYESVEIPDDEAPEEYHWTERRAEILMRIREAGHPSALNQDALASRYGVSQAQISQDMDRLAEYVRDHLHDRGRRALVVDTVVQKCVQELMDEGQYRAAAKTALEWEEFAASLTDLDELHERVADLESPDASIEV